MIKKQKIIIDTNLWISFLISKNFTFLEHLVETNKIELLYSNQLILEIDNVVNRPKFKKYFDVESVKLIYDLFKNDGIEIELTTDLQICRDQKDNFLLNLAIDGNADYLITGDKDLLILEKINNTKIITIADFNKLNPIN